MIAVGRECPGCLSVRRWTSRLKSGRWEESRRWADALSSTKVSESHAFKRDDLQAGEFLVIDGACGRIDHADRVKIA